jgi:hypothetical protein
LSRSSGAWAAYGNAIVAQAGIIEAFLAARRALLDEFNQGERP